MGGFETKVEMGTEVGWGSEDMGLEFTEATRSSNLLSGWVMDIYLIETNSQNRQGNEASVAAQGVKLSYPLSEHPAAPLLIQLPACAP